MHCRPNRPSKSGFELATKCIGELAIRAPGPIYPTRGPEGTALNQTFIESSSNVAASQPTSFRRKLMSLLDSISRTVKGLLNDAADTVQDPSRDARQIVRELDDSIAKAENSLIEIEAQVATQQSKLDAAAEKVRKYEDGAKRALQAGNETLAREALAAQAN